MMTPLHYIGATRRACRSSLASSLERAALGIVLLGVATGCVGPSDIDDDILDRESFVSIYVSLRMAALDNRGQEIHPTERDSILEVYGVTADDLIAFADAHGDDVRFMAALWAEVEDTINQNLSPNVDADNSGIRRP